MLQPIERTGGAALTFVLGLLVAFLSIANVAAQEPARPAVRQTEAVEKPAATGAAPTDKPAEVNAAAKAPVKAPEENAVAEVIVFAAPAVAAGVAVERAEGEVADVQMAADVAVEVVVEGQGPMLFDDPTVAKLVTRVAVDNALVRRLCKPNDEQLAQIKKFDKDWVKGKAKTAKVAGNLGGGLIVRAVLGGLAGVQQADRIDPAAASKSVIATYKKELKAILSTEQFASFEAAVAAREKFRCKANAKCVVAILDDRLALSETQREEIAKELESWKGISDLQASFYFQNQSYIPTLPKEITKLLNPSQRIVMAGMQQVDFQGDMFGEEMGFLIEN